MTEHESNLGPEAQFALAAVGLIGTAVLAWKFGEQANVPKPARLAAMAGATYLGWRSAGGSDDDGGS